MQKASKATRNKRAYKEDFKAPFLAKYCRTIARGLEILEKDPPKQQEFLRSIIDKIVIEPGAGDDLWRYPGDPDGLGRI